MKQETFTVSKRGGPSTTCVWDSPESLQDPRWKEVVSDTETDINELAVQNLIIKIQSGARNKLEEEGAEAAQKYVSEYQYGTRSGGGGYRRPTVAADQVRSLGFTPEQLAALRAAGVRFEADGVSEEEAALASA